MLPPNEAADGVYWMSCAPSLGGALSVVAHCASCPVAAGTYHEMARDTAEHKVDAAPEEYSPHDARR
jgi:hypothetical protein